LAGGFDAGHVFSKDSGLAIDFSFVGMVFQEIVARRPQRAATEEQEPFPEVG
jgi:hypothetical protein